MANEITPEQVPLLDALSVLLGFDASGNWGKIAPAALKQKTDAALSETSENPVQNKVITKALADQKVTVDAALSETSENPVQNKVIAGALEGINGTFERLGENLGNLKEVIDGLEADVMYDAVAVSQEASPTFQWISNNQLFLDPTAESTMCRLHMTDRFVLDAAGKSVSCRLVFIAAGDEYTVRIDASNSQLSETSDIDMLLEGLEEGTQYVADISVSRVATSVGNRLLVTAACSKVSMFLTVETGGGPTFPVKP